MSVVLPLVRGATPETRLGWFDPFYVFVKGWLECGSKMMGDLLRSLGLGPDKAPFLGVAHPLHPAKVLGTLMA